MRLFTSVRDAVVRLGFAPTDVPDSTADDLRFDGAAFMHEPKPRGPTLVAVKAAPGDNDVPAVVAIIRSTIDNGCVCPDAVDAIDPALPDALATAGAVLVRADGRANVAFWAALASGSPVVTDKPPPDDSLRAGDHYVLLPSLTVPPYREAAADLALAVAKDGFRFWYAAEQARRISYGDHTAAHAAIRALARTRAFDPAVLNELVRHLPQVGDEYMWTGERALLAVVCCRLPPGDVLELGVGSGGSLAVMRTFSARPTTGIDNFSYGGAKQKSDVAWICEATGATIIEAKTSDAPWSAPLALLHVDAGHDYEDCRSDFAKFAPFVVPSGVLAVDDYGTAKDMPGVRRATDEFIGAGGWEPITMGPKLALWRRT